MFQELGGASTSLRLPSFSLSQRASWCLCITGKNLRQRTVCASTQHYAPPTHNHFTALWTLSRTTWVSWYQKIHFTIFWIFWCKMKITQLQLLNIHCQLTQSCNTPTLYFRWFRLMLTLCYPNSVKYEANFVTLSLFSSEMICCINLSKCLPPPVQCVVTLPR